MSDDIVTRLHDWARGADEQGVDEIADGLRLAAAEIARLTAERDEARRLAIALQVQVQQLSPGPKYEKPADTARRIAEERGWDCFKEDGK